MGQQHSSAGRTIVRDHSCEYIPHVLAYYTACIIMSPGLSIGTRDPNTNLDPYTLTLALSLNPKPDLFLNLGPRY